MKHSTITQNLKSLAKVFIMLIYLGTYAMGLNLLLQNGGISH
jgi:hypothetical protein